MLRYAFSVVVLFAIAGTATTQETKKDAPAKGPEYVEVTVYYAVVVGDGTIKGATKEVKIGGPYHTPEEADNRCAEWDEEHKGKTYRLTKRVERKEKYLVTKPSGTKQPELVRPEGAREVPGGATAKDRIRVTVLKLVDGKWVRQQNQEQVFSTDDYDKASEYYWLARSKEGYTARWYDSKGRKPKIIGTAKPWVDIEGAYNKPKVDGSKNDPAPKRTAAEKASKLAGTVWQETYKTGVDLVGRTLIFREDGKFFQMQYQSNWNKPVPKEPPSLGNLSDYGTWVDKGGYVTVKQGGVDYDFNAKQFRYSKESWKQPREWHYTLQDGQLSYRSTKDGRVVIQPTKYTKVEKKITIPAWMEKALPK